MSVPRRVVVTGIGVVTGAGMNESAVWDSLMAGRTGIRRLAAFDVSEYKTPNGAEVDTAQLNAALQSRKITLADRAVDMAMEVSAQALSQAGELPGTPPYPAKPWPVLFGTGLGASQSLYQAFTAYSQKGIRGLRPTSIPRCMANAISAQISMRFHLTGPNYVIVSACTSSTSAIGTAFRMIRDGYADAALCGGADAVFDPFVYAGWNNLGVMSKNPDPATCCRPFDAGRDGCVLGEGAGALVLETLERATARGARIRAEIAGFGESSDAEHITSPSAEGQARAIRAALASAGLPPEAVGFVNAHGTATRANDECESRSIRLGLGAAADTIPVASNKSFFGHTLGASGVVESVVTILGLEQGRVPGNLNLEAPDPECSLRLVGRTPLEVASPVAMKNSFAFGGNNGVLIYKRWKP